MNLSSRILFKGNKHISDLLLVLIAVIALLTSTLVSAEDLKSQSRIAKKSAITIKKSTTDTLEQDIAAAITHHNPAQESNARISLASELYQQGLYSQSLDELKRAEKIISPLDGQQRANLYNIKGLNYLAQKKPKEAASEFELAYSNAQSNKNISIVSMALSNQFRSQQLSNQPNKALDITWEKIITIIPQLMNTETKTIISINVATTALSIAKKDNIHHKTWIQRANTTLELTEKNGSYHKDKKYQSFIYGLRGEAYFLAGQLQDAKKLTSQAIYFSETIDAPQLTYRWQWQYAQIEKQLGDIKKSVEAYRDAAKNLIIARNSFNEQSNEEAINSKLLYFELADLLLEQSRIATTDTERKDHLYEARNWIELFKGAELQDYFQDDCVAELKKRTVSADSVLENTAIIYPILLPSRTVLLISTHNNIHQYIIEKTDTQINEMAHSFRKNLVQRTTRRFMKQAQELYKTLIQPIIYDLDNANITTLVIVPQGSLQTIPFSALHDGKQFLIQRFAIAYTPGLALTDARSLPRNNINILLNGLTESVQNFPALPNVDKEITSINAIYPGKKLINEKFNEENIRTSLKDDAYNIIHIASHGNFSSNRDNTFVLTYDSKLSLDQLQQLMSISRYREQPVELLTLSACQTASGDDKAALGLAGIAIKSGARSALATLWSVNDVATSELIGDFYQQLSHSDLSKAEALRNAQIALLKDPRYKHPSYWSPFLLIGNWL